jgi:hypothetical protein
MNRTFLTWFFSLFLLGSHAQAQAEFSCDQEVIFKLLVEKGLLDMGESKVCADMSSFPAIRLDLREANYQINGVPVDNGNKKQEEQVVRLHQFFNSVLDPSEKLGIYTKGFADGTRNTSEERDVRIKSELFPGDKFNLSEAEKRIKPMDPKGFEAIAAEVKKSGDLTFKKFQENTKLLSLVRNSYLAKARGENICQMLFKDSSKCQNEGQVSPTLDQGKTCFQGCCDGRRGAQVHFLLPDQVMKGNPGLGRWQPEFEMPNAEMGRKMQFAASFSVLDLPIPENKKLDAYFLSGKPADPKMIEEDRARFREAMKGNGCETNDLAVDSARKLWWKMKNSERFMDGETQEAFKAKNFSKAYEILSKSTDNFQKNLFRTIVTGGIKKNNVTTTADSECAPLYLVTNSFGNEMAESEYKKCELESSDPAISQYKTVYELMKSSLLKEETVKILASNDKKSPGIFWVFDQLTGEKKSFTYKNCDAYPGPIKALKSYVDKSKDSQISWGQTNSSKKFYTSCFHAISQNPFSELRDDLFDKTFNASAGKPTDHLNCLSLSKAYIDEFKNPESKDFKQMTKPFCKVAKDNKVVLEFDYHKMKTVNGKHGFICKVCGNGVTFDSATDKFNYSPREKKKNASGQDMSYQSWQQSLSNKNDLLTFGASKHPRTFLIPNCGKSCENACDCLKNGDVDKLLKTAETVDFTDLSKTTQFELQKYKGDTSGSFACFFTPQIPQTCGVDPDGQSCADMKKEDGVPPKCKLQVELEKLPSKRSSPTQSELAAYQKKCTSEPFPMTESQCASADNFICSGIQKANNCPVPNLRKSSVSPGATAQ